MAGVQGRKLCEWWPGNFSVVGKHLHCSFVFKVPLDDKLFFEIFVCCMSIPDG
jgi:hypothetical protein